MVPSTGCSLTSGCSLSQGPVLSQNGDQSNSSQLNRVPPVSCASHKAKAQKTFNKSPHSVGRLPADPRQRVRRDAMAHVTRRRHRGPTSQSKHRNQLILGFIQVNCPTVNLRCEDFKVTVGVGEPRPREIYTIFRCSSASRGPSNTNPELLAKDLTVALARSARISVRTSECVRQTASSRRTGQPESPRSFDRIYRINVAKDRSDSKSFARGFLLEKERPQRCLAVHSDTPALLKAAASADHISSRKLN